MKNKRIRYSLNRDWEFRLAHSEVSESVTLPHTWNAEDGCDGGTYYRGKGIYKRTLDLDEDILNKQIFIEFEGANTVTELLVNGISAGIHEGGYAAFRFDITDFVNEGKNYIAVIVDNSPTEYIAPINEEGDFTKMGGIYRGVSLIAADKLHIELLDFGSSGVYLTPKNIIGSSAELDILVKTRNDFDSDRDAVVHAQLFDAHGICVAEGEAAVSISAGNGAEAHFRLSCNNIILWDGIENPYLYTCRITLENDEVNIPAGFRTIVLDNGRGVLLNGKRTYLKGVNYHQDTCISGWAMTDDERERDYAKILEMGANAVRMAHYQHHAHEYDICDRSGLAVWSEIPLINRTTVGDSDTPDERLCENLKQQLTEMIRQNYNHPSVFFWGISNELYDVGDTTKDIYAQLVSLAKNEDRTRPTIYADNTASSDTLARSASADVVGYNRYDGWYYSDFGRMSQWINEKHRVDSRPTCVSEYGGAGAISQHMDTPTQNDIDPNGKRHWEEYLSVVHEETWADLSCMDNIFGSFIWCMFDFASDSRVEGDTEGQNDKGMLTRTRIEKDVFYFYKSLWNSDPMVHLTSKRFAVRPNVIPVVKVYSNCDSAELFVNGNSCGIIRKAELNICHSNIFKWYDIAIDAGTSNLIKVVALFADGTLIEDSAAWIGC